MKEKLRKSIKIYEIRKIPFLIASKTIKYL